MGVRLWLLVGGLAALFLAAACATPPPAIPETGPVPGTASAPVVAMGPGWTPTTTLATVAATPSRTPTEPRLGINPPASPAAVPQRAATPTRPPLAGRPATIMEVQGTGVTSPYVGQIVTISGVVTGSFQELPLQGFFVQSVPGDGDVSTPDGIFVFQGGRSRGAVLPGDSVEVVGTVSEVFGRTTLDISQASSVVTRLSSGNRLPEPVELRPPAERAEARRYFERLEGMLVRAPDTVVVGPTSRFGEFAVVRADSGLKRVFRDSASGPGRLIVVNDGAGADARYEVATGDVVTGIIGPLDFSFGQFKVEQLANARLRIVPAPRQFMAIPPPGSDQFTVASFNVENLFDSVYGPETPGPCDVATADAPCRDRVTAADYQLKLTKTARAIRDALGAPTIVGIQEVESLRVLETLAAQPELTAFGYRAVLLEGSDPRGSNVGLLYRAGQVTVQSVSQRNECTTKDYGFTDADARCSSSGDGNLDGHVLAARPPLVVELVVGTGASAERVTVIVAHFKSKGGNDPENMQFTSRRTAEARLVANAVQEFVMARPDVQVMVMGDLNDSVDSPPLRVLTAQAPLQDLAADVPAGERYSYIYNGESEVLDHILVTSGLRSRLLQTSFARIDADYPAARAADLTPFRASDHDPAVARFRSRP